MLSDRERADLTRIAETNECPGVRCPECLVRCWHIDTIRTRKERGVKDIAAEAKEILLERELEGMLDA